VARERLALPFHRRTGGSVALCNSTIPWQHICTAQELPHRRMQAFRFRPSRQSEEQLTFGYRGDADSRHWNSQHTPDNSRMLP
jgi:hypothetical protein